MTLSLQHNQISIFGSAFGDLLWCPGWRRDRGERKNSDQLLFTIFVRGERENSDQLLFTIFVTAFVCGCCYMLKIRPGEPKTSLDNRTRYLL